MTHEITKPGRVAPNEAGPMRRSAILPEHRSSSGGVSAGQDIVGTLRGRWAPRHPLPIRGGSQ